MKKLSPPEPNIRVDMTLGVRMGTPISKIAKKLSEFLPFRVEPRPPGILEASIRIASCDNQTMLRFMNAISAVSEWLENICFSISIIINARLDLTQLRKYCRIARHRGRIIGICRVNSHTLKLYHLVDRGKTVLYILRENIIINDPMLIPPSVMVHCIGEKKLFAETIVKQLEKASKITRSVMNALSVGSLRGR